MTTHTISLSTSVINAALIITPSTSDWYVNWSGYARLAAGVVASTHLVEPLSWTNLLPADVYTYFDELPIGLKSDHKFRTLAIIIITINLTRVTQKAGLQ